MDNFNIRNARPQDCPVIAELIRGLAHYEKLDDQCQVTPELLEKCLFGDKPECYAVVGWITEEDGTEKPVSFALYCPQRSLFRRYLCASRISPPRHRQEDDELPCGQSSRRRLRQI